MKSYGLEELRAALVRSAHAIWEENIHEPTRPGEVSEQITHLWEGVPFWGAWLRTAGGCPDGYTRPPDPDWCGIFVAYAARHIGDHLEPDRSVPVTLKPELAKRVMSSTYRLASHSHWRAAGFQPPAPGFVGELRPGDIVTVNATAKSPYGTHIVLVADTPSLELFETYEGNAHGTRGDGSLGQGVVKNVRRTSTIARVYPLSLNFFEGVGYD